MREGRLGMEGSGLLVGCLGPAADIQAGLRLYSGGGALWVGWWMGAPHHTLWGKAGIVGLQDQGEAGLAGYGQGAA